MQDKERRQRASVYITGHYNQAFFQASKMYGVPLSQMTKDELAGALCYVMKNPKSIIAMKPDQTNA